MKKFVLGIVLSVSVCVSGCLGPGLSGEMSREQAILRYNGGIAEDLWIEELDTVSRNLPMPGVKSVQLADGFLFYKTELSDGMWMVTDVIPPADAPDALKALAKSLRKDAPKPLEFVLSDGALFRNGVPVSVSELSALVADWAKLPESQRPEIKIFADRDARAADLSKFLKIFESGNLAEVEVLFAEEKGN